eukprot:7387254-Heterocapsa_arctica.AAC.1
MGQPARPATPAWSAHRATRTHGSRGYDVSRSPHPKGRADIPPALMGGGLPYQAPAARPRGPVPPVRPPPFGQPTMVGGLPARPPWYSPPPNQPSWHSTYTPGSTPDRTLSPQGAADPFVPPTQKGHLFLQHPRPPPPRPATPPFDPNAVQEEEQPWCDIHRLRGDHVNCWKCEHVRNWWRHHLERGN